MDSILVKGGQRLNGRIPISGAKNACLALMPAALLCDEPLTLTNAPRLSDIRTMTALLESLGCEVAALQQGRVLVVGAETIANHRADYEIVRKMRASILVLGPMLARDGHAEVSLPGMRDRRAAGRPPPRGPRGARGGARSARRLCPCEGAARASRRRFHLSGRVRRRHREPVDGGDAREGDDAPRQRGAGPEIVDLARCLRRMGAEIEGEGTETITITGVDRLSGATHPVVTDRIELGTYMLAPAIVGGEVELIGGRRELVSPSRSGWRRRGSMSWTRRTVSRSAGRTVVSGRSTW